MDRSTLQDLHPLLQPEDIDLIYSAPMRMHRKMAIYLEKRRTEIRLLEHIMIDLALAHKNNAHLIPAKGTGLRDAQRLWMHLRQSYEYLTFQGIPPFAHNDPQNRRQIVVRQIERIFHAADIGEIEDILGRPLEKKPASLERYFADDNENAD